MVEEKGGCTPTPVLGTVLGTVLGAVIATVLGGVLGGVLGAVLYVCSGPGYSD